MNHESSGLIKEEDANAQISRRDFLKGIGAGFALTALGLDAEAEDLRNKEGSPFNPETHKSALLFVANAMGVTLDDTIALPEVIPAEEVSDADFNAAVGFDTEGKRQNLFLPPGIIFLLKNSEMHNLVHEYVHYIQYTYKGVTDGTSDEVENEAVAIQNLYRERGTPK